MTVDRQLAYPWCCDVNAKTNAYKIKVSKFNLNKKKYESKSINNNIMTIFLCFIP